MIHIEDKQTNKILDYIPEGSYWAENRKRQLSNNRDSFVFETLPNKRFSKQISDQNRIVIPDRQFGYAEFVIVDYSKVKNIDKRIQVTTTASYLLLKKSEPIAPFSSSTDTATKHVTDALANNDEWQVGKIAHTTLRSFDVEEHTNTYDLLKLIASTFDLELQFRIAIENGKIVRYVDMVERIGGWRGFEIAYRHNLLGIKRKSKSAHIVTALLGLGPADSDGNRKEVLVTDEDARRRWGYVGKDGQKQHYYAVYYPESTDQNMTLDRLRTLTENELEKRIKAKFEYEVDFEILGHEVYFGDTVRILDEEFNPPLYLEARVHTLEEGLKKSSRPKATLGDYVEFTQAEATALFKLLQKQVAAKIEQAQLVEYTYDKATINSKDQTVFENGKTFAQLQASAAETNAKEHADTVASQAQAAAESYADTVAGQALTDAKAYAVAKTVYDTKMQEIAGDLADKADLTYVNGELVSKANKADVYTISEVDNRLLNYVGVTTYQTDMDGVVTRLNSHDTLIAQNEDAIALKADATRVNTLEGTVSDHTTTLSVHANEISSKAESSTVNALKGRVTTAEGEISTMAGQIELKADSSTVSSIESRLSTAEIDINGLEGEISLKVSASYVSGAIDDINIGGQNLLKNTRYPEDSGYWTNTTIQPSSANELNESVWLLDAPTSSESISGSAAGIVPLMPNSQYTFSLLVKRTANVASIDIYLFERAAGGTVNDYIQNKRFNIQNDVWERISFTFTTHANTAQGWFRIDNNGSTTINIARLSFTRIKLEQGNKATAWTPAEEERVHSDEVIASINLSPEKILLDAARIEFTGHVFGQGATFEGAVVTDNGVGGRVELIDGAITTYRNAKKVATLDDNGMNLYSEIDGSLVGMLRDSIDNDDNTLGIDLVGKNEYVMLGFSDVGDGSAYPFGRFNRTGRSGVVAGAPYEVGKAEGQLELRSNYYAYWGDGSVQNTDLPKIKILNYNSSEYWGGIHLYTGRGPNAPGNDPLERFGLEHWQYQGDGTAKQMYKVDRDANASDLLGDMTYFGIWTDNAYLPYNTAIKAKDGVYYQGVGSKIGADIEALQGDLNSNMIINVDYINVTIGAGDGYANGTRDYSLINEENLFAVFAQPTDAWAASVTVAIENVANTGFRVNVAGTGRSAGITGQTIQVRLLMLTEPAV